jgi:hypothetical protein
LYEVLLDQGWIAFPRGMRAARERPEPVSCARLDGLRAPLGNTPAVQLYRW